MELLKQQLELEQESVEKGVAIYRSSVLTSDVTDLQPGMELLKSGMVPMVAAIDSFLAPSGKGGRLHSSKKVFKLLGLSSEELAYITLRFCLTNDNTLLQKACISLASNILDHHEYMKFKRANPGYLKMLEDNQSNNMKHRRTVVMLKKRQWGITDTQLSSQDKLLIGLQLIEICVKVTGLVTRVAVPSVVFTPHRQKSYNLVLTENTRQWIERQHDRCELLCPVLMPMIIPPKKWTSATSGGYFTDSVTLRNKVVKTRNKLAIDLLGDHDLTRVFGALNAIQETPWKINGKILAVLSELSESASTLGGIPSTELEDLPVKPWTTDADFKEMLAASPDTIKQWKVDAREVYTRRLSEGGRRTALLSKLTLARKFLDYDSIYFPHTLDWRGRVYPLPSWVNPQADDTGKALIHFAIGKPLGSRGLFWLKVHGANTYGVDKVSFEDRVKWVEDNHAAIIDSAENPLDGLRFWAQTDESPYCFLAFCFEYAEAVKNPEGFVSRLPIALDGTCNGLQHFCGMLKDAEGGAAVNLVPSDKPRDIYSQVASVVSELVLADANSTVAEMQATLPAPKVDKEGKEKPLGMPAATRIEMAKLWVGKIDRGVAKRPTMTKPYGAKKHGYKYQLIAELKKRGGDYLNTHDTFRPAVYLADKMNEGINTVVVAARDAMDFLKDVSRVVSKTEKPITWTTPIGFPAWQEYREMDSVRVDTFWGEVRYCPRLQRDSANLNKVKMSNSISPNFVHSMDASMLMTTVLACVEKGVSSFAMIHDSYGTHACDTELLAESLRTAFVDMYSKDVLGDFLEEVKQQIPEELHSELPELPQTGELVLEDVKHSRYFFA